MLLHHLKHNKALHTQVVLLSIVAVEVPDIDDAERVRVTALPHGFFRVIARYGFMESPNVPQVLALCEPRGLRTKPMETSYYLGRERLLPTGSARMARCGKSSSCSCPATHSRRRVSSVSRPTASWSSALRSSSERRSPPSL